MIKLLRKKFALSEKGARDMIKAFVANTVYDIVLMFPVALLYFMVRDLLNGGMNESRTFYICGIFASLALIFVATYFQYKSN